MSQFVEVELVRAWQGRRAGDRFFVWPNAASLLGRMRVATLVPLRVESPEAVAEPVAPPKRRGGWPKGRPRRVP